VANLSLRKIILTDRWPGYPNSNLGIPTGGFEATTGHSCVTAPTYPPMTKIQVFQNGADASSVQGPYTMIYLAFNEMSGSFPLSSAVDQSSDARPICGHFDSTAYIDIGHYAEASDCPYIVSNTSACMDATSTGMIAIGCNPGIDVDGTTLAYQWSWMWCGGVCPHVDITRLDFDLTCSATAWNHVQPVVDTSHLVIGVGDASFEGICGIATTVSA